MPALPSRPGCLSRLIHEESGATAIEYGLIAALVTLALIAALTNLHGAMDGLYAIVTAISAVL